MLTGLTHMRAGIRLSQSFSLPCPPCTLVCSPSDFSQHFHLRSYKRRHSSNVKKAHNVLLPL